MKGHDDYQEGWTTTAYNPKTGKMCSGGAARNMRIAQQGGVTALEDKAKMEAFQYIQPLVESLQKQLDNSMVNNQKFAALLVAAETKQMGSEPN